MLATAAAATATAAYGIITTARAATSRSDTSGAGRALRETRVTGLPASFLSYPRTCRAG
jgi:hypothetical protein